jgi:hypothetical protein
MDGVTVGDQAVGETRDGIRIAIREGDRSGETKRSINVRMLTLRRCSWLAVTVGGRLPSSTGVDDVLPWPMTTNASDSRRRRHRDKKFCSTF